MSADQMARVEAALDWFQSAIGTKPDNPCEAIPRQARQSPSSPSIALSPVFTIHV